FAEYLAAMALLVLAWTIADARYQFRIETAPLPIQRIAFISVTLIGILTLLTDLWRAQGWFVPIGGPLTPALWQGLLGLTFLLTFLVWAWFAFIRPPRFGPLNAEKYISAVYRAILRGSPDELAVISDEIAHSSSQLIKYAPSTNSDWRLPVGVRQLPLKKVEAYANNFLLLIADRRFCRAAVAKSPVIALALFREIALQKKYDVAIGTFTRNIVSEALLHTDSFLYHETEGYQVGLLGHHKPLSQAIFGDYAMLSGIGTALDADVGESFNWNSDTWGAFLRAARIALKSYVASGFPSDTTVLTRLHSRLEFAASDLYQLDGSITLEWRTGPYATLRVLVDYLKDSIEILGKMPVPTHIELRTHKLFGPGFSVYDMVARSIFHVIFCAASVRSPISTCWIIQHNTVWTDLFESFADKSKAGAYVRHKVRRLIYNEIKELERFPNFKGAKYLAFCLNVMGLMVDRRSIDKEYRPLHRALIAWTRKNYELLRAENLEVAEACLVDGMSYDSENRRLVKTYPAGGLRKEPNYVFLDLLPLTV
ncbi:MAG: hypothetical protein Q8R65_06165, partial [Polynucleobacter sp.]|nr:hypothetical protein [Polynucleobacter sp.]